VLVGLLRIRFRENLNAEQVLREGLGTPSEGLEVFEDLRLEFELEDLLRPFEIVGRVPLGTLVEAAGGTIVAGSVTAAAVPTLLPL
jgi:hypothetical protein